MCILALRPASADLRQLFIATRVYDGSTEDNNNKVLRIPLEGPDAGELLPFGGLADGVTSPSVIAVHPGTGRLYVGDHTTRQLLEFEINAAGENAGSRSYGTFVYYEDGETYYPDFHSIAVRPSTGEIYLGCFYPVGCQGIYRMREGIEGAVKLVGGSEEVDFSDECFICFNPDDDGIVYAGTGFENYIRLFDADDGSNLGYLERYDDAAFKRGPPEVRGHFLPHLFFVAGEGGGHDLLACTYINSTYSPTNRRLIKLDLDDVLPPVELPVGGPTLGLSMSIFDFVRDDVTGTLYAGGFYCALWEIAGDYGSEDMISEDYPLPRTGMSKVALSYGHSAGADADGDGLAEDVEQPAYGTDPNAADTDEDGFSDFLELSAGSDPLENGWTAGPFIGRINFAPRRASGSTLRGRFSLDEGWSFTAERNYGWN